MTIEKYYAESIFYSRLSIVVALFSICITAYIAYRAYNGVKTQISNTLNIEKKRTALKVVDEYRDLIMSSEYQFVFEFMKELNERILKHLNISDFKPFAQLDDSDYDSPLFTFNYIRSKIGVNGNEHTKLEALITTYEKAISAEIPLFYSLGFEFYSGYLAKAYKEYEASVFRALTLLLELRMDYLNEKSVGSIDYYFEPLRQNSFDFMISIEDIKEYLDRYATSEQKETEILAKLKFSLTQLSIHTESYTEKEVDELIQFLTSVDLSESDKEALKTLIVKINKIIISVFAKKVHTFLTFYNITLYSIANNHETVSLKLNSDLCDHTEVIESVFQSFVTFGELFAYYIMFISSSAHFPLYQNYLSCYKMIKKDSIGLCYSKGTLPKYTGAQKSTLQS